MVTELEEVEQLLPQVCPSHGEKVLLWDNARPHRSKVTTAKLQDMGWIALAHPPYSPDISPCDYHVFLSLEDFCEGRLFNTRDDVKRAIEEWISTRRPGFWKDGVYKLEDRWQKVVQSNGDYITQN